MDNKKNASKQNCWFRFLEALRKRAFWVPADKVDLKPKETTVHHGIQGGLRR